MFGQKTKELKTAEEQRRIARLKIKTEKELAKVERYKATTAMRKSRGGIGGSFAFADVTPPKTKSARPNS